MVTGMEWGKEGREGGEGKGKVRQKLEDERERSEGSRSQWRA